MEKYARHYDSHLEKNKDFAGAFLAECHLWPKSMQAMIADVIGARMLGLYPGRCSESGNRSK
jgi:hypothetical protein